MKNRMVALFVVFCFVLSACGADESDTSTPATADPNKVQTPTNANARASLADKPIVRSSPRSGWLWYLTGVDNASPDSLGSKMRCLLKDSQDANILNSFMVAVGGGALIGMGIHLTHPKSKAESTIPPFSFEMGKSDDGKLKGSLAFDRDEGSGSRDNIFWNFFDGLRGELRGPSRAATLAFGCEMLLGGNPIPGFAGLIGTDSMVGSAALTLSVGSMAFLAPFVRNGLSQEGRDFMNTHAGSLPPPQSARELAQRFSAWANSGGHWKVLRHQITPTLTLLGLGFGVYWLVDTSLQHGQFGSDSADCR